MEDNGVMTVSVIPQYKPLIAEFKDIDKLSSADFEIFVRDLGNDSNLLIVFYVQIMPDDFVMQL
ncbi:TPA: hypothetical protein ACYZVR_003787, partial [Escherichia coli]